MIFTIEGRRYLLLTDPEPIAIKYMEKVESGNRLSRALLTFGMILSAVGISAAMLLIFLLEPAPGTEWTFGALVFLLVIASGVGAFIVTTKLRFAERATDYFKRRVYWGWERHSIVGPRHFSYRILFGEVFEEPTSINSLIKGDPAVLKRVRDLLGDKEVIDADWYIIDDALSFGSASQSIHYRASKLAKQQWLIEKLSAELGPLGLVSEERRIELIREVTAEWEASIVSDLDAIQRGNTTAASMLANLPA